MSADAVTPDIVEEAESRLRGPRGSYFGEPTAKQMAALQRHGPAKGAPSRNPSGLSRRELAVRAEVRRRVFERAPEVATALMDLAVGRGLLDQRVQLAAIQYVNETFNLVDVVREQMANGHARITVTWEGPAEQAPTPGGDT